MSEKPVEQETQSVPAQSVVTEAPMATVEVNEAGQLVLNDPVGLAVARAVEKHNCRLTLEANADRVEHFRRRAVELGRSNADVVVVLANVNDHNGSVIADILMPGHDWQQFRDRGEVPFARGLAGRAGVQEFAEVIDKDAADKLWSFDGLAVVVVDRGVVEVF